MPAFLPGKTGGTIFGGRKGEGGSEINGRYQGTVILKRVVTVMDRSCRKAELIFFVVHAGLSDISYNAMLKFNGINSKLT